MIDEVANFLEKPQISNAPLRFDPMEPTRLTITFQVSKNLVTAKITLTVNVKAEAKICFK